MRLIEFNAKTVPNMKGRPKYCMITFSTYGKKSGYGFIGLNARLVEEMGLTAGDRVTIGQDPEDPMNWFIYISEDGFNLISFGDKKHRGLRIYNARFVKMFFEFLGTDDGQAQCFRIGTNFTESEGVKMYPILIGSR